MAVRRRWPGPGLLHHSDRGCTYTCADYQRYLATHGITCRMSRRADGYDNAVMEGFFATVKKEKADRFPSYSDAKMALFDYIEVFCNQRRRHSTLGQISPAAFEYISFRKVVGRGRRRSSDRRTTCAHLGCYYPGTDRRGVGSTRANRRVI
jgi:transposase InsO family protein